MIIDVSGDVVDARSVVVKMGGSVLEDDSCIERQAKWIKKVSLDVDRLFVVVSAKKGVTDRLVRESERMCAKRRACHLIQGEVESAMKLFIELKKLGVQTKMMMQGTGDFPVVASGDWLSGCVDLETSRGRANGSVLGARVCVIPGFGAETANGEIILLGRNASDLVAAAVANVFEAQALVYLKDTCGILTDVNDRNSTIRLIDTESLKQKLVENNWKVLHPGVPDMMRAGMIGIVQRHTRRIGCDGTVIRKCEQILGKY